MLFIQAILLLFLLYISKFYVSLFRNYLKARKSGLPLVVVPIHPNHLIWMIISTPIRPILKRYASDSIYARIVLSMYGWEFHEKRIVFRTLKSESIMLVTCGRNELFTIDPEAVVEICRRAGEFDKPPDMKVVADMFGPSLLTSVGDAWSRQRKLVTGIINERISKVVFEETWRQSRAMVDDIEDEAAGSKNIDDARKISETPTHGGSLYGPTFPAMKRIASNVLSFSAYGKPAAFKTPLNTDSEGAEAKFDMTDCINIVIADILIAAFVPGYILSSWPSFLPGKKMIQRLLIAKDQYPGHVKKRIDEEREILKKAEPGSIKSNLTSMLIQSSEQGVGDSENKNIDEKRSKLQLSLSEDELSGNLFIFTTAGFETTSNALTFALVVLMAEPKWQDWLIEEIDELFKTDEDNSTPDYAAFHPKAFRCLSFMMEVLRLYPPVVHLARCTSVDSPTTIKTSQHNYTIPPDSHIYIPFLSLHTNPKIWRNLNSSTSDTTTINETLEDVHSMTQDEYLFRPSRWINQTLKQLPDGTTTQTLFQPPKGTYMPFSGGPRICPGQKMAQVEFVCVILALFKDHRIEAMKLPKESDVQVQDRMKSVLRDSHAEMTMVIERLNEVQVRFVKRR